jgi:hypothetical protein
MSFRARRDGRLRAAVLGLTTMALLTGAGRADETGRARGCFDRVVQPSGWTIPEHGPAQKHATFAALRAPAGITYTEFSMSRETVFSVPRHYVDGQSLVLLWGRFHATSMKRLEVDGTPFAFLLFAKSINTGDAADMWWLDRDGEGKYTEVRWNPDLAELPSWVMKRIEKGGAS